MGVGAIVNTNGAVEQNGNIVETEGRVKIEESGLKEITATANTTTEHRSIFLRETTFRTESQTMSFEDTTGFEAAHSLGYRQPVESGIRDVDVTYRSAVAGQVLNNSVALNGCDLLTIEAPLESSIHTDDIFEIRSSGSDNMIHIKDPNFCGTIRIEHDSGNQGALIPSESVAHRGKLVPNSVTVKFGNQEIQAGANGVVEEVKVSQGKLIAEAASNQN